MCGGIGSKSEVMTFGRGTQVVENHTRLHAGEPALSIDLQDAGHVLRKVENHGHIAALTGERSAAATGKNRRPVFVARRDGRDYVVDAARKHNPDRQLPVVRTVRRVKSTTTVVKAHLPTNFPAKSRSSATESTRQTSRHVRGPQSHLEWKRTDPSQTVA